MNRAIMQLVISLIAIASAALVGPLMAGPAVPLTTEPLPITIVPHCDPIEELTKEQLMYALRESNKKIPTANALYKARDKDSTELVEGVTVAKLIKLNQFVWSKDCTIEELADRAGVFRKIEAAEASLGEPMSGLLNYADWVLTVAASSCHTSKSMVVANNVNKDEWLEGLLEGIRTSESGRGGPVLARYILTN